MHSVLTTNKLKSSSQPISQRHISETTTPQKKRKPASQPLPRQQTQSAQQQFQSPEPTNKIIKCP